MNQEELQKDAIQKIIDNKKLILHLAPRSGKTKIALSAVAQLTGEILISVPSEFIIDSWKNECEKWKFKNPLRLTFCCHASLHKQDHYDVLIIDEIHSAISDIRIEGIKQIKPDRIIGLSGSMSSKAKEVLKEKLGLEIKMEYTVGQAVEHNVVADYRIYVHKVELLPDELKEYNKLTSTVNWCKENGRGKQLMFSSLKRARFLYNLKSKNEYTKRLINNFDRYLLFAQLTNVADELCTYSFHAKSKENYLELFKAEEINHLGVCKLANEGVTIPNLDTAVIVAVNSSEISAIQRILRTMTNEGNDKIASIHVIISKDTQEEKWLENSIKTFDNTKIITK